MKPVALQGSESKGRLRSEAGDAGKEEALMRDVKSSFGEDEGFGDQQKVAGM